MEPRAATTSSYDFQCVAFEHRMALPRHANLTKGCYAISIFSVTRDIQPATEIFGIVTFEVSMLDVTFLLLHGTLVLTNMSAALSRLYANT